MSCGQSDFTRLDQVQSGTREPGTALSAPASPWLIVSNNPELISAVLLPKTLYKATLTVPTRSQRFRLYLWHVNRSEVAMEFVFLVGAASGTVVNMTAQEWIGPENDLSVPGICLAKAQLFGTLDAVNGSIPLAVETPIWSATVQPGEVIAKLFEFELQNASSTVTVRTVAKLPGSSNGDFTDPVAADDVLGHVRGWWPRSRMRIRWGDTVFDVNPMFTTNMVDDFGVCEDENGSSAPPELDTTHGFGKLTGSDHAYDTANLGAYGVDLHYEREIKNTNDTMVGKCFVSMRSRNTGYKYWGAARVEAPESPQGFGVPKIPLDLSKPNQLNSVDLMQADVPGHAIEVAPGGLNAPPVSVKVHVVNGGAATLPVSVFFARSNAIAIPHEVPPGGGE